MKERANEIGRLTVVFAAVLLFLFVSNAQATIDGISGPSFSLAARADHISTADGGSLLLWGYANGAGRAQYPGPTLIVTQGETVTVALTNNLSGVNTSIVFPGQEAVTAVTNGGPCANQGLLTCEAVPGRTVTYSFTAANPGTYLYYSGTNPELQVEMGLVGALIVRPLMGPNYAYGHAGTKFDREYMFLLSEMDPRIHQKVEFQGVAALASTDYLSDYQPNYWFINGRTAPDDIDAPGAAILPTQPYGSLVLMRPGERVLMRVIGAGRDSHPFHHHGNHARVIARQGRLLESAPGAGPDISHEVFTINSIPGETVDAIFEWTGKDLGWDIYGTAADGRAHTCKDTNPADGYADADAQFPMEYCADHYKPFPVTLPETQFIAVGPFYSGSPFMGAAGTLPPGEGGLNPWSVFPFMWHSHNERELTNFNIFPGGMLTMLIIVPPNTPIP